MEESAFIAFLEQALDAWRQAFGRGNTGQLNRQTLEKTGAIDTTKSGRILMPDLGATRVEGPDDDTEGAQPHDPAVVLPYRGPARVDAGPRLMAPLGLDLLRNVSRHGWRSLRSGF